jgi:hypothetical protein
MKMIGFEFEANRNVFSPQPAESTCERLKKPILQAVGALLFTSRFNWAAISSEVNV